jgi:hypothetical protein
VELEGVGSRVLGDWPYGMGFAQNYKEETVDWIEKG